MPHFILKFFCRENKVLRLSFCSVFSYLLDIFILTVIVTGFFLLKNSTYICVFDCPIVQYDVHWSCIALIFLYFCLFLWRGHHKALMLRPPKWPLEDLKGKCVVIGEKKTEIWKQMKILISCSTLGRMHNPNKCVIQAVTLFDHNPWQLMRSLENWRALSSTLYSVLLQLKSPIDLKSLMMRFVPHTLIAWQHQVDSEPNFVIRIARRDLAATLWYWSDGVISWHLKTIGRNLNIKI